MKNFAILFVIAILFAACEKTEIPPVEEDVFVPKYDTLFSQCEYVGGEKDGREATMWFKSVPDWHPNYPIVLVVDPIFSPGFGSSDDGFITVEETEFGFSIPNQKVWTNNMYDSIYNATITFDDSITISYTLQVINTGAIESYTISSH